ncbi:hypothetical protein RMR10_001385 [Agrobacterium rosae]|uniref:hypothetical protein n=1 Tax=Agrobacterium rosae TaxID=1972867 RepID=UPI002A123E4B|nr:hypothetical protein [Agrobacterium rosae]MDX8314476.1 hypothetical protein [Agrobacterium rosae]
MASEGYRDRARYPQNIEQAWSPVAAWIELRVLFEDSVKRGDIEKPRLILDYARYCLAAPHNEINTAVAVGFIEHLAEDDEVRNRLPDLITAQDVHDWRDILAYHSGSGVIDALSKACLRRRKSEIPGIKKAGQ